LKIKAAYPPILGPVVMYIIKEHSLVIADSPNLYVRYQPIHPIFS
jgi:hypothetical protein